MSLAVTSIVALAFLIRGPAWAAGVVFPDGGLTAETPEVTGTIEVPAGTRRVQVAAITRRAEGYYIIGLDGPGWVDLAGIVMFLGISLGVTVHAVGRYLSRRGRPRPRHSKGRVYMYDAYDRIWHWVQASVILLLIATGLIIHKPHLLAPSDIFAL